MNVCFYFQVHQPYRLKKYSVFDIGNNNQYFDEEKNKAIVQKVAEKCYLPTNKLMLDLINTYRGQFKIAFSITGIALDQFERYAPEVISSFQKLAQTGCVEFLNETSHHSLAFLFHPDEFLTQVELHRMKIKQLFGQEPKIFRNTELIYNNDLAKFMEKMGYQGILAEGADRILGKASPNYVYQATGCKNMKVLLKNYKLSDDIAFRFSNPNWKGWPLTAEKYATWLAQIPGESINLFMDYETFGEHQWDSTGIFAFLKHLPAELLKRNIGFSLPSEVLSLQPRGEIDIPHTISWADVERDCSAWLGNKMQNAAVQHLYALRERVMEKGDAELIETWRRLSTSDHCYYMCTKWFNDGTVHKYFNPYDSPYDAHIAFMNVLTDMETKLGEQPKENWMKV